MAKKSLVPGAKNALDQFKMQAASEVGVNLTNGYNGDLTSRQAGSVGIMVPSLSPSRISLRPTTRLLKAMVLARSLSGATQSVN